MSGRGELRIGSAIDTAGLDQQILLKGTTARIALISTCITGATQRTFPLDIAIGKEHVAIRTAKLVRDLFLDIASIANLEEELLRQFLVTFTGGSSAVMIKRDPQSRKSLLLDGAISVHHFPRSTVFFLGRDRDGNPMIITATDENRLDADQAQISIVGIRRKVDPSDVPQMRMVICVR